MAANLVAGCTDCPVDLLLIVPGLLAKHLDVAEHSMDVDIRDVVGSATVSTFKFR